MDTEDRKYIVLHSWKHIWYHSEIKVLNGLSFLKIIVIIKN